ncbi:bifunctional glycosyltransferase/class I SAM-dependent methyltransferase [Pseudonocardia sp. H11422]|uniref:bifunctional glycosyltransferase/class I SAM-dependent methyltransferase n=1 Tax=Pseudonocardia sp. H11422 TaxID=2835866 RepID=UPI001BDC4978|nr:bifunctional glycosyltransferase/class I SAM-dependent methyltransferase [Pseudonocardia sp. H11422]
MSEARRPRLLVFVIAYYAEETLESVLERIPARVHVEYDCEILVVDDASEDRTFEIGHEYRRTHPEIRMTVLRNEFNQGYGGNQKVGYAFALERGFDFVAMVHGDGQYAPEELPRLMAPLRDGQADAVFGSRMMTAFGALKGGMPLYKYVGNRVLTRMQNTVLRTNLSEFHSGYRVYSVRALERIPFLLNSNLFHFDTEIIIQLLSAGQRIVELPVPTYYGTEISRVNGIRYAKDVTVTTLQKIAHRAGILYQRRFEPIEPAGHANSHYDLKLGYPSSHQLALEAVPAGSRVLDMGAGPGGMAQQLVEKGCEVAVVDQFPATGAPGEVEHFQQDLDDPPVFDARKYDYLLMLDVIEHLKDPERFLERIRDQFDYAPRKLVLTTPNVAFAVQRLMLALGQFNYGSEGILDRTHTRLFTFRSLRRLLVDHGFRIVEIRGIPAPFPKALGHGRLGRTALRLNQLLICISKTLFAYQIFVVAECTPGVRFILSDSHSRSESSEAGGGRAGGVAPQRGGRDDRLLS